VTFNPTNQEPSMTTANTITTAPTAIAATQRPIYTSTGRTARCIAFLASAVLSTVLIGSVVIGMTTAPANAAPVSERA
jgi:hypothetical protein